MHDFCLCRRNLCSVVNSSCETLGLAHVAGMCQPHRSCNVNQDTGLSLAFTVAHELGHKFVFVSFVFSFSVVFNLQMIFFMDLKILA